MSSLWGVLYTFPSVLAYTSQSIAGTVPNDCNFPSKRKIKYNKAFSLGPILSVLLNISKQSPDAARPKSNDLLSIRDEWFDLNVVPANPSAHSISLATIPATIWNKAFAGVIPSECTIGMLVLCNTLTDSAFLPA